MLSEEKRLWGSPGHCNQPLNFLSCCSNQSGNVMRDGSALPASYFICALHIEEGRLTGMGASVID